MLGTCATVSAIVPLARTKKGGARCGSAKVKENGAVAVAQRKNGTHSHNFRENLETNVTLKFKLNVTFCIVRLKILKTKTKNLRREKETAGQ